MTQQLRSHYHHHHPPPPAPSPSQPRRPSSSSASKRRMAPQHPPPVSANAISTSSRQTISGNRPPAQVFTRGHVGSVTVQGSSIQHNNKNNNTLSLETNSSNSSSTSRLRGRPQHQLQPLQPLQPQHAHQQPQPGDVRRRNSSSRYDDREPGRRRRSHSRGSASRSRSSARSIASDGAASTAGGRRSTTSNQRLDCSSSEGDRSSASAPSLQKPNLIELREPLNKGSFNDPYMKEVSPARSQLSLKQHVKTARHVIEDLNRAQGTERRIAALSHVCESFDHVDEAKHNIELYHGAALTLAKLLGQTNNDGELRMICAALEMVFRGSPKSVQAAYERIGTPLMSHLLVLMERSEARSLKHADIFMLTLSRIFSYLSRCPELRTSMCRHGGMLEMLTRTLVNAPSAEIRVAQTRTIASLSNNDDNKVLMFVQEGLLDNVLRIAYFDSSEFARMNAATILMNFASSTANQLSMARNDKILGTLVKMVLSEKSVNTRESVISAIQNLAFAKENRARLVMFKEGVVLEALKKSILSDPDAKARRRVAGALTNLSCDATAERIGNHPGLLEALAIAATKDVSEEVQTRASLALTKIANSVTINMRCYSALLDALVVASLSKASNNVAAVLRVKARDPENRSSLARHTGVLDTLADICMSDTAAVSERDNAMRAIMHLVNEDQNRRIMCSKTVLDALVKGANLKDPDLDDARDSAIRALQRLATDASNRPYMARHEGLLIAVAKAVEREAKWEESGRNSEHGYLAKPLLMSLLLAM